MPDLDVRALFAVYGGARGALAPVMVGLTLVGGGWAVVLLVPLVGWSRTRRFALALALAVASQAILVWWAKRAVGRVRPWISLGLPPPIGSPHDGSFPSGHAAGSFCVAAFLAMALPVAWPQSARRVRAVAATAGVFAALVALSRVYLGAHFPSDVVAGALLGAVVGAAAGALYARANRAA